MEQVEQGDNPSISGELSGEANSNSADYSAEPARSEAEKMVSISQSKIDSLISSGYKKGLEKATKQQSQPDQSQTGSHFDEQAVIERAKQEAQQAAQSIYQKNQEEHQKRIREQATQAKVAEVVGKFKENLERDKDKYPDLLTKETHVDISDKYPLVEALSLIDNPADVLNELDQNPALYNKLSLASRAVNDYNSDSLGLAAEIKQIASKLKNDETASKIHNYDSPPSQVKSTHHARGATSSTHEDMLKDPDYMF
jgi:hypothetical protein